MTSDTSTAGLPMEPPPKCTLFCWECDHQSSVDGDWALEERGSAVAYVCPKCSTTITERPRVSRPEGDDEPSDHGAMGTRDAPSSGAVGSHALFAAWSRMVTKPVRAWTATVEATAFRDR
ncbi:hypothetical protein OB919_00950 [Halobacteria archaeon AArc-curdl1]|uniref:DUF8106 domain-containing protein n=1 Tax=Natronosalvus hydrolyticus TaxID=2979988 RepID=A0AAP2Z5J1_9EURY|nr:hypothetical protein [Halobacteria archaeon AArc-curdl1]